MSLRNGVSYSNSTKYNPRGNGQVERFNGVIWKSVQLALRDRNLPDSHFESVLKQVLHCQRSLLCTATNATPHERLFSFPRRSGTGDSLPSWLLEKGPVLVRRHNRKSKYTPIVSEVDLVSVNPSFARVRYPCGREDSVSLRDLAPLPTSETVMVDNSRPENNPFIPPGPVVTSHPDNRPFAEELAPAPGPTTDVKPMLDDTSYISGEPARDSPPSHEPELRRSGRIRKQTEFFEAG